MKIKYYKKQERSTSNKRDNVSSHFQSLRSNYDTNCETFGNVVMVSQAK